MDTLQSAIVLSKLKVYDKEIKERIKIANKYNSFFKSMNIKYMQPQKISNVFIHSIQL